MQQYSKQQLTDIRNELYDMLPTGQVQAWDMITAVKKMFSQFDEFIDELPEPVSAPSVPSDDVMREATRQGRSYAMNNRPEIFSEAMDAFIAGYAAASSQLSVQQENLVDLMCMVCGKNFKGELPKVCCSGQDCGCMGQPIDPVVCSKECYDNLPHNRSKVQSEGGLQWVPLSKGTVLPDEEDFLLKFDNGEIRRFKEEEQPFAVATHYLLLPNASPPSTANTEEGAEPKVRSLEEQGYDTIEIGDTIRLYGKETKVKNFAATFNQSLERWETIIITEGRGDPFERSIDAIEVWDSEENKWIPASSLRIIPH